jgi:hypothetical protein
MPPTSPRRKRAAGTAVLIYLLLAAGPAAGQPGSASERRRREIEQQLHLPPATPRPPAAPQLPEAEPEAPAAAAPDAPPPAPLTFAPEIHRLVLGTCRACHAPGAAAAASRLVLRGSPRSDYDAVRALVDPTRPRDSLLLTKASGQAHGGGPIAPAASRPYRRLLAWISAGALFEPGAPAPVASAPRRAPPAPPPPPPPASPVAVAPVPPVAPVEHAPSPVVVPPPARGPDFTSAVEPILTTACRACHTPGGAAAMSHLLVAGDPVADYNTVRAFVDPAHPASSVLLGKASGAMHGGGAVLPASSDGHRTLLAWIAAGAPGPAAPAPVAAAPGDEPPAELPSPPPPVAARPAAPPPTPPAGPPGLALPFGLRLDGRFDLNYERRGIGRGTSFADGTSVLRSYHQFLFLSRTSEDDPIALTVEVIALQIWEASYRHRFQDHPLNLVIRAGKILVPFGNDPLFHQAYGGLVGFDQKILPPVWAQEGAAASLVLRHGPWSLSGDAYGVRGYTLRQADGVLNLQNDFSPADALKPGLGLRLGAARGPLTLYYSLYFNPLGFGRRLVMQAADLGLWRLHGVPVLDRLAFGVGFLRADVSGGGPGLDYYHFGSYYQVRLYATDFLYLQYRQGLRTFNNRRGTFVDETRLDSDDASTHTVGLVGRYRGLTAGIHYFVNLEKADEIDNDFFRVNVAYEF